MTFAVDIHHYDDYAPSVKIATLPRVTDVLSIEIASTGVRLFVGSTPSARRERSLRAQSDSPSPHADTPQPKTRKHVGHFWVLVAADQDAVLVLEG